MVSKVLWFLAAIVVMVSAEHGHSSQYIHRYDGHPQEVTIHDHHGHHHIDYYAHPKYDFKYEVKDPHTHDHHTQHEERDGDVVKGYYSLDEPDGTVRHVHYTADKHTGFHADVKHVPHLHEHPHHHY